MKKVFENIKKSVFALALVSSGLFAGCSVGLGEEVDLIGPEVTIETPDFMESVKMEFTAEGTAFDNEAVTRLTITFEDKEWVYENGAWNQEGAKFENGKWSVDISLPDGASGEYVLKVSATDAMKNTGKNSFSSRTVVYDTAPPVVFVTQPSKLYENSTTIEEKFNSSDYKDFTNLPEYLNEDLTIQGYQDEDFNLKELKVKICDKEGNKKYPASEDWFVLTENLRNWSITVPADELGADKAFLQIITQSKDEAGNESLEKSHGFFCWWPEADKPWVETAKLESTQSIPDSSKAQYYPGYKFQGQCYDDDGIKSITVKVTDSSGNQVYDAEGKPVGYEKTYGDDEEKSTFATWNVTLPSVTEVLKLEAFCTDLNGNESAKVTGYLKIMDITVPQLQVNEPSQTESLFGDENGIVTIKGIASDDAGVKSVKMVWLKNEKDLLKYSNAAATEWGFAADSTDTNGNKRWIIQTGTGNRPAGKSTIEYEFKKEIDLLTDLGLGTGAKLTGQTFILRVEDTSEKSNTLTHAVQGDIKKPEIEIKEIYVKYSDDADGTRTLKPGSDDDAEALPAFGEETRVKVTGTWSDDSTDVWTKEELLNLVKKTLTVEGLEIPENHEITVTDDGKWETGFLKNARSGGLSVKVSITDLAGSTAVDKASYAINTDEAAFERITASNADGNYKAGDVINIQMKFTKAVTVTGNPVLKLSNGREVSLKEATNGTKIHVFEYTIQTGDDAAKLNAEIKNADKCTWKDSSTKSAVDVVVGSTNDLAFNKTISIVTQKPVIEDVSLNDDGDELSIAFKSVIYKNTGTIELTQKTVSAVPAVLTESEFRKLNGKNSNWAKYYSKTTNGCDENGNADLTTKYVLNYEYNSNDSTLISMYKAADADKVLISVRSSNVYIDPENKNILKVRLTGSYALPCKGAEYSVTIPESLVSDVVGNLNDANDTKTVTLGGVEKPVVRVSKGSSSFNTTTLTATQPLKSAFKIDCETPNATVKYGISSRQYSYEYHDKTTDNYSAYSAKSDARGYDDDVYASMDLGTGSNGVAESAPLPKQGTSPAAPASFSETYSGEVSIGSSEWKFGEKFFIGAEASVTGAARLAEKETAYATANRSLFVFQGGTDNDDQRIWLRGGDSETGDVLTAGFPLSWNMTDSNGVALLTNDGDYWYYISWEISTTAYVGVMIGEPEASGEKVIQKEGTTTFGVNAWVPFKSWYCLYPGESRIVETDRYEYVYGKQRDWFKWNWQDGSGGGGASQEEKDLAKMNIVKTVSPSSLNGDGVSQTVSCTDEWQRLCVEKWAGDTNTNGSYLVFDVSKDAGDEHYIDIWYYSYGNKREFGKVEVTSNGTAKIQISDTASGEWKWNNIYIGGKGVTINSVKIMSPYHEFECNVQSMGEWGADIRIRIEIEKDNSFDISEPRIDFKNWGDVDSVTVDVQDISNGYYIYDTNTSKQIQKIIGYGVIIKSVTKVD